ncbi:hypothetical protein H4R21_000095 [Coemansia helicoidea]|uniref:Uncharacterized protein n=1 Tax=Coemansia helicoidea TaxID=1286919 RepID=A0ACC1LHL6_9FUNG|nr:hypothetical protein H4R21_000095 [Coemansia helicoidea]
MGAKLCDVGGPGSEWDRNAHIVALFTIFGASAAGVFLPIVWQTARGLHPMRLPVLPVQLGQFFGAGVIVATAFLHLLPAASSALSSPCLDGFADRYGAWACLIALAAVFSMHGVEWWLMELWTARTAGRQCRRAPRLAPLASGIDNCNSDSSVCVETADDDDDNDMLFPAYSRAYNASRIMQPPALSPPVNPFVFGASTASPSSQTGLGEGAASSAPTSRYAGFSLSKFGHYAALVQSRQQLAAVVAQHSRPPSRYLYSDPQFPMYAPSSIWPVPPVPLPPPMFGRAAHGHAQAKSTPELMRKLTKSTRASHPSSVSSGVQSNSSNAVSLRPDSFTHAAHRKRRSHGPHHAAAATAVAAAAAHWKERCLSMPRLPHTTLEAGLCDSLLEPLPPLPGTAAYVSPVRSIVSRVRYSSGGSSSGGGGESGHRRSGGVRKSVSPQSLGRSRSRISPRPISAALAASARGASKRMSLQTAAAIRRATRRGSGDRSELTSPSGKLDTVHEADGAQLAESPASDVSAGMAYASATSAIPPPSSMHQTFHTTRSGHRASRPLPPQPPHVLRAAPSSCAFRSLSAAPSSVVVVESGMLASQHTSGDLLQNPLYRDGPTAGPSERDGESTAIHSPRSAARLSLPIEVKRRALATYVLELGITLYSVLVGLALAVSDRGFLALFIATCFHQFFEGQALGVSLAELYWIEAQLAAHSRLVAAERAASEPVEPPTLTEASRPSAARPHHAVVDVDGADPASACDSNAADVAASSLVDTDDFVLVSLHPHHRSHHQHQQFDRHSKSRRTLASMATSFAPEPWLVNPQLEKTLATGDPALPSTTQPPTTAAATADGSPTRAGAQPPLPRFLVPRAAPERMPGWWKAWVSALAFTMTTPTGIIIGLALRNVYEPHSRYALLLNGVLQSICTGILVYVGLVSLILGGFASPQVKQMRRLVQVLLFVAVYAGAAAMASIKIWI